MDNIILSNGLNSSLVVSRCGDHLLKLSERLRVLEYTFVDIACSRDQLGKSSFIVMQGLDLIQQELTAISSIICRVVESEFQLDPDDIHSLIESPRLSVLASILKGEVLEDDDKEAIIF